MADSGPPGPNRYQFDDLTVDTGKRLVLRDTSALEISGLTYDLLLAIVRAAPNIISADELVDKVWSGRPTSPETITQRAMMLRQSLGDSADAPRYIEVVRGQGFRLIPEVSDGISETVAPATAPAANRGKLLPLIYALIGAIVIYAGIQILEQGEPDGAAPPPKVLRSAMNLGTMYAVGPSGMQTELALSPDGTTLAYTADHDTSGAKLYVRRMDQFEPTVISDADGIRKPYFSPDGEWILFETGPTTLMKVSVRGGPPQNIIDGQHRRMYGATWSNSGKIIFSTTDANSLLSGRLMQVSDRGGIVEPLLDPPVGQAFIWPRLLPDEKSLLFTIRNIAGAASDGSVAILDLETGEYRTLLPGAFHARYASSGHILFGRDDALWAAPFDLDNLRITGPESPVINDIQMQNQLGDIAYDFSNDGLLVYLRGSAAAGTGATQRRLVWVDHEGNEESLDVPNRNYSHPRISPDGNKLAVSINDFTVNSDIWIVDLARGTAGRLTFNLGQDIVPSWSPDSKEIYFSSIRPEGFVFAKAADGTGQARLVSGTDAPGILDAISPDGQHLILIDTISGESDMYLMENTPGAEVKPLLTSEFDEEHAAISPDGNFIAYRSDETGSQEIYVRTFPDVNGGKWQVSIDGGHQPMWSKDGLAIYFRQVGGSMAKADVRLDPNFAVSTPETFIENIYAWGAGPPSYDISPVDQRFLAMQNVNTASTPADSEIAEVSLAIVDNWFEELKRISATDSQQ